MNSAPPSPRTFSSAMPGKCERRRGDGATVSGPRDPASRFLELIKQPAELLVPNQHVETLAGDHFQEFLVICVRR
jgi:hypothetical protein